MRYKTQSMASSSSVVVCTPIAVTVMAVFKLFACVLVLVAATCAQKDSFESTGIRVALKLYEDCSKADSFSPCLKKKAITFFDRVSRMEKLTITDGIAIVRDNNVVVPESFITEEQLDSSLPRSSDSQEEQLNNMIFDRMARFISSRTLEVSMPKLSENLVVGEARKKMKGGGMMNGMMMGIAAKMAALIPIAIAGLFLLAGKALITAKIALLLSGIIAIKKLFASKQGGGGGGHGGWQSGGGGWQSGGGGGGGWDKRSIDDAQKLAYKTYAPK